MKIYVDKSEIILELNQLVDSSNNFICISRPRRFGKSLIVNLISAYYSKGCDTRDVFSRMKLAATSGYDTFLNKFNLIKLDLNGLYQNAVPKDLVIEEINETLRTEFEKQFSNLEFKETDNLAKCIKTVYDNTGERFVIIIDEYDVLVRERVSKELFDKYLSFLNGLFKDLNLRPAIALAYITGIVPIVRDKVQSKLNDFDEYTMIDPGDFAEFIGFTKQETEQLCKDYCRDFAEYERWYDGYKLSDDVSLFNPKSVVTSITRKRMESYWSQTGSFEALRDYILMDFEGIKQDVIRMISGESVSVNVTKFKNTLDSITNKDNAFTYLIHLGYLSYNAKNGTCHIPNREVCQEWVNSIEDAPDYSAVMSIVNNSKQLLDDTINGNEDAVAKALDAAHTQVTSIQTYNDEHCFQSAICLAYFYANTRYTLIKELPTGKGFADLVLIPYQPNIPALVIELKHNKSTETALQQIKEKNYCQALSQYKGNLLFVAINYDEKTKEHSCKIERVE